VNVIVDQGVAASAPAAGPGRAKMPAS
jgi:hypothetical protein